MFEVEGIFYAFYRFLLKLGAIFDRTSTAVGDLAPAKDPVGFQNFHFYTEILLFLLGAAALVAIVYFYLAKKKIMQDVDYAFTERYTSRLTKPMKNLLWDSIQQHVASESQSEWKLAVIEADKLLDDLTVQQGFFGETLGERLKNADETLLRNLQDAWEAHKIRNRIAHETGYHLSRREAQRAIAMYERVFREFRVI